MFIFYELQKIKLNGLFASIAIYDYIYNYMIKADIIVYTFVYG